MKISRVAIGFLAVFCSVIPTETHAEIVPAEDGAFHVRAGGNIQDALDAAAAADARHKHVKVHAGTYRPATHKQAFLHFNRRHDGITLEAVGDVILTAANPDVARPDDPGFPAIVNHVVYFGDGVNRGTILRGFKITGANNFVIEREGIYSIEPDPVAPGLEKSFFFYADGGGIKVFGRSYPILENLEVYENYSSPCGAGISIEHQNHNAGAVRIRNCIFRNNSCPVTGSALDLLWNSWAIVENCLFVDNQSNCPMDQRAAKIGKWKPDHGAGALTLLPGSRIQVRRCTFTGNRNGIDDSSLENFYEDSIFWNNNAAGGWPVKARYELDLADGSGVRGCFIQGDIIDLKGTVDPKKNVLECNDPEFDAEFRPRAKEFAGVGYRPVSK